MMDLYPILFDLQLVIIALTLIVYIFDDRIKRWEDRMIRRIRHKGGIRAMDGKVICRDNIHRMSGDEIVKTVNDVYEK